MWLPHPSNFYTGTTAGRPWNHSDVAFGPLRTSIRTVLRDHMDHSFPSDVAVAFACVLLCYGTSFPGGCVAWYGIAGRPSVDPPG